MKSSTRLSFSKLLSGCIILIVFVVFASCSDFKQLGKNEKKWVYKHPFAALKIKKVKKGCDAFYAGMKNNPDLDTYENGGKLDAYRHMFYTLMFTTKVKERKVISLGIAHEKDNYLMFLKNQKEEKELADSISCEMDLLNNMEALNVIQKMQREISFEKASQACVNHIKTGYAYFIKRNEKGNYVRCDGSIINMKEYAGKWDIPKCLIQK
ncbi:MAG: hypothetical protein Q8M29_06115 [Bacteroidota bacterium]|nr:hypothetical protein [Bacteroidota bacterium]